MPERRRLAPYIAAAILAAMLGFFVVLAQAKGGGGESADTPLLDRQAPAVVTTTLEGQAFDLTRRRGSWVVLNFFNSTCRPCVAEHPELVSFVAQQQGRGADAAEMYTVINDDSDKAVRDFFAGNGGGWPVLRDPNGSVYVAFGVAQVPETWVIDPAGFVRARFISQITAADLQRVLDKLQAGGP